eukprot:5907921-Amphidinium_carterae.1
MAFWASLTCKTKTPAAMRQMLCSNRQNAERVGQVWKEPLRTTRYSRRFARFQPLQSMAAGVAQLQSAVFALMCPS